MIVIKGNLIINGDKLRKASYLRQAQKSILSETSSEKINNIVAFANLEDFDITNATIFYGDINSEYIDENELILVTEDVVYTEGGEV